MNDFAFPVVVAAKCLVDALGGLWKLCFEQGMCEFPEHFVAFPSVLFFRAAAPEGDAIFEIPHDDGIVGKFEERGLLARQLGLAIAFLLRDLASGNVADDRQHESLFFHLQRTQHDIDGDFHSIFAESVQIEACAHGAGMRLCGVGVAVARMAGPETFRQQEFHWPTNQFRRAHDQTSFRSVDWPAGSFPGDR